MITPDLTFSDRTYPTHRGFAGGAGTAGEEGRAALFRVLAVYARFNRRVAYCQGMASLAGMLLMQMSHNGGGGDKAAGEEDAFWALVSLLERHKYLVGYFEDKMERLVFDATF